jgi:heme oxygenase
MPQLVQQCPNSAAQPGATGLLLSAHLRSRTADLHKAAERHLGLPDSIHTLDDYKAYLTRFCGLYAPLEQSLSRFHEWLPAAIALPETGHAAWLSADLVQLGIDPGRIAYAPPAMVPRLPTFAHAVGALYVLEGSSLGGKVILRQLASRMGPEIEGATQFFGGRGEHTGAAWKEFRTALDAFGRRQPDAVDDVVRGAESVFRALLEWFTKPATR